MMRGRIGAWSVVVVLVSWQTVVTGVAITVQRNRRDVFQPKSLSVASNTIHGGLLKVSSPGELLAGDRNSHLDAPIPDRYLMNGPSNEDAEDSQPGTIERHIFDKRGLISYKLKYGGLGKRKFGSNKLRFGGLGKRLSAGEEDEIETQLQPRSNKETNIRKGLLATTYLISPNGEDISDENEEFLEGSDDDQPLRPAFDPRQQRSKMGKGLRYSGLGKRLLTLS